MKFAVLKLPGKQSPCLRTPGVLHCNRGFTLVEILAALVVVSLLFTLIYATFFSVTNVTSELHQRMQTSEKVFRLLTGIHDEAKAIVGRNGNETVFGADEISFLYMERGALYPSMVRYRIERNYDGAANLLREQENILDGYSFSMPVLERCESVEFLFHDGKDWISGFPDADKVKAFAIEIVVNGETYFYPLQLNVEGDVDEA